MTNEKDVEMQDRIVRQLEAEQNHLSPAVTMRLDRARRQILAGETGSEKKRSPWPWLATAGTASLAAVLIVVHLNQASVTPPDSLDLDLLTLSEFDLLDQDPEFMVWLADQDADLPIEDSDPAPGGSS